MEKKDITQEELQLLIMEYGEIGQWCRNDETVINQFNIVIISIALGALILPFTFWEQRGVISYLILGFGCPILLVLWGLFCEHVEKRNKQRVERAREIEGLLKFKHLKTIGFYSEKKLRGIFFICYSLISVILSIMYGVLNR